MSVNGFEISPEILELSKIAEADIKDIFEKIDKTAFNNTAKVMAAFRKYRVSENYFYGTTG